MLLQLDNNITMTSKWFCLPEELAYFCSFCWQLSAGSLTREITAILFTLQWNLPGQKNSVASS